MTSHDIVVIGGGPAGYAAALYGASCGLNVGLVEKDKLGGTCLHTGCIPAKELLESASVVRTVREAENFGIKVGSPEIDMAAIQTRKQEVVSKLAKGLEATIKGRGITVYSGAGSLANGNASNGNAANNNAPNNNAGKKKVLVSSPDPESKAKKPKAKTLEISAENIILAAGSIPKELPNLKVDGKNIMTSDHLLSLDRVPKSIAIVGAGAIGAEFASLFVDLGSRVLLLEALDQILAGVDKDIARVVEKSFTKRGIEVCAGTTVTGYDPKTQSLTYNSKEFEAEIVVLCVGRQPYPDLLGLENSAATLTESGFVRVDENCETDEPDIYAVGDLINTPQLAHTGFAEGILAVRHILGEDPPPIDYEKAPWGIYCQPEIAFAGLTEQAAISQGYEVETTKHSFMANGRAQIIGETEGMVKIVAESGTHKLLGVHMAGPWVTEQLGAGYLAINWEATAEDVAEFVFPHPTLSEMFSESALALTGRPLHG